MVIQKKNAPDSFYGMRRKAQENNLLEELDLLDNVLVGNLPFSDQYTTVPERQCVPSDGRGLSKREDAPAPAQALACCQTTSDERVVVASHHAFFTT